MQHQIDRLREQLRNKISLEEHEKTLAAGAVPAMPTIGEIQDCRRTVALL